MSFNEIIKKRYLSWKELESQIEQIPNDQNYLKGEIFEQFVYLYFKIKKQYYQLKNIYRIRDLEDER